MTINSAGNVGIGTAAPTQSLDVYKAGNSAILMNSYAGVDNSTTATLYFRTDNSDIATFSRIKGAMIFRRTGTYGRGNMYFSINDDTNSVNASVSDAKMTILGASGNVGIGTVTPGAGSTFTGANTKLEVAGDIHIGSGRRIWFGDVTNANPFFIGEGTLAQAGTDTDFMVIEPRQKLVINSTSYATKVGIGTTEPGHTLTINSPGGQTSKLWILI